jgi:hypothetical protein
VRRTDVRGPSYRFSLACPLVVTTSCDKHTEAAACSFSLSCEMMSILWCFFQHGQFLVVFVFISHSRWQETVWLTWYFFS